jgi:hypothetical protein
MVLVKVLEQALDMDRSEKKCIPSYIYTST